MHISFLETEHVNTVKKELWCAVLTINNFDMEYTIENYKKGQVPNIKDIIKIGEFTFDVCHNPTGYWLNGIGCDNDAFVKYLKGEDKYHFAKRVTAEYGGTDESDGGTCPYIKTINGFAELIKALWDKANPKESESGLLKEDDIVNIGPFQYHIGKYASGFFLSLDNRKEVREKFRDIGGDGNDIIFRLLKIDKNRFFSSILEDSSAYEAVSEESRACPYAKTIEGINEVISRLQEEYNRFVGDKKKHTKQAKTIAELEKEIPWNCDSSKNSSSKDINITIPKKSNPVKLKITL